MRRSVATCRIPLKVFASLTLAGIATLAVSCAQWLERRRSGATVLIVKDYFIYEAIIFSSWGCQGVWGFTIALRMVNSLRIQAVRATLATVPAARRR